MQMRCTPEVKRSQVMEFHSCQRFVKRISNKKSLVRQIVEWSPTKSDLVPHPGVRSKNGLESANVR